MNRLLEDLLGRYALADDPAEQTALRQQIKAQRKPMVERYTVTVELRHATGTTSTLRISQRAPSSDSAKRRVLDRIERAGLACEVIEVELT